MVWIIIVIVSVILVVLIAVGTAAFYAFRTRKRSLLSLQQDMAAIAGDNHPIYEEISPIEILQWYAETMNTERQDMAAIAGDNHHIYEEIPPIETL